MKEEPRHLYLFGPFRLDPAKRILWRGSEPVPLPGRAFDTLLVLLQNAEKTVEKDQIIEAVWGGAAVEENNLTQCISTLRKALGETKGDPKYILTLPGTGYRFVADVTQKLHDATAAASPVGMPAKEATRPPAGNGSASSSVSSGVPGRVDSEARPARRPLGPLNALHFRQKLGLLLFLAAAVFAGYWVIKEQSAKSNARKKAAPARRTMLAVLPFQNLTGDPSQANFIDGLTEEITTQLGNADQFGVIARTSVMRYKHTNEGLHRISGELGVNYVVEGSVRQSAGRVRISVQLIQVADQTHVWAQSYERPLGNVLALEAEVAQDVQEEVTRRLNQPRAAAVGAPPLVDPNAYDAYLKGLYFFNRRDEAGLLKAVASFQEAIRRQPGYASAYAGLANCYILLTLYGTRSDPASAKAAALKAVTLDDSLAEGHTAFGAAKALFDWDWPGAGSEFRRALSLNPNSELAHHWYAAFYLAPQGRNLESIAEMRLALKLDPVSLIANTDLGWAYFISGRYGDAFRQYQKTLELSANFVPLHFRLSEYYLVKQMYADWSREIVLDYRLSGDAKAAAIVERAYRQTGYHGVLLAELSSAKAHGDPAISAPWSVALNYALLNRKDDALRILTAMYDRHDPSLLYIKVDPVFSSLKPDPRFQTIERHMGLIQ